MSRQSKTTPEQRIAVIAWHKVKVELGSCKTKAAELGITESAVRHMISVYTQRERRENARKARISMEVRRLQIIHRLPCKS